jgi:O-glycosyl hydrolase
MKRSLAGGSEVYSLWNIILDETGKSIDSKRPWSQNRAIVVKQKTGVVTYTPMFYAFAHYSRETGTGSHVLSGSGFPHIYRRIEL